MSIEKIKSQVFDALEDENYKWRTIKGIAKQANVSEAEVWSILDQNMDSIVQSSVPSTKGDYLFTTKEHFRKKSTVLDKIYGAFKGRIR